MSNEETGRWQLLPPPPGSPNEFLLELKADISFNEKYRRILKSQCGATDDSQAVEQYDGTLGVTTDFVNAHQSMVGHVRWNTNLAAIYTNPGNVSGQGFGTGTLISDNLFLTAGHVFDVDSNGWTTPRNNATGNAIPSAEIARNMQVHFNFQADAAGNLRPTTQFSIVELVEYRSGNLDFAIVRLDGNPRPTFGIGLIGTGDHPLNDAICIIGHPASQPKRIEAGVIFQYSGNQIRYNDIDTLGGNSGSAVWHARSGTIIGVHTNGGCTTTGGFNFGVRISSLLRWSPTLQSIVALQAPAIIGEQSLKALDVTGISRDNGANVQQWEYWAGPNQRFRLESVGDGFYRFPADHSQKVLDVSEISHDNGARIHQWDWWNGGNQRFRMEPVGRGYRRFVAQHTGKVIDVSEFSMNSGAPIHQWDWHGGVNQRFRCLSGPVFPLHSGKALDIEGFSQGSGARLQQWAYHGGVNQLFHFEPLGDGTYRVVADHSGKVLDVEAASVANGARIFQWPWHGGRNQRFWVDAVGGGSVRIIAVHSGKVLDVTAASGENGVQIVQWDWHGGPNQRFRLFTTPLRAVHSNKVLDVSGVGMTNGAALIQFDGWGGHNQRFYPELLPDGSYRFIAEHSGKVLDVSGFSRENGARIIQWDWHGGPNQRFRLEPSSYGEYRILAVHSGKVLDVSDISTANGAPIVQWDWWGGFNQLWRLG